MALIRGIFLLIFCFTVAAPPTLAAPSNAPPLPSAAVKENSAVVIREFYGTINKVTAAMAVINQIPFAFDTSRDIGQGGFSPGDYVMFRLSGNNKIVMMTRTEQTMSQDQVTADMLHAADFQSPPATQLERTSAPPASAPDKPTPIKRQNGVWTN